MMKVALCKPPGELVAHVVVKTRQAGVVRTSDALCGHVRWPYPVTTVVLEPGDDGFAELAAEGVCSICMAQLSLATVDAIKARRAVEQAPELAACEEQ